MRSYKLVSQVSRRTLLAAVIVLVWLAVSTSRSQHSARRRTRRCRWRSLRGSTNFSTVRSRKGEIPGAIVLIQRHGKPVYFKCFGKRDVDAGIDMTPDTIFPLHSLTKTVTSFAAMMLVDRGKIKLDDPVSKYIPSFAGMKVGVERKDDSGKTVLDLVPLRRPVTIEDLLLHTSGITYGFYGQRGPVKAAYDGIYLGDFDNAGFAERIAKVPLAEQPRTLWDYGHSIDVLGRVIEVASGQSLYQFEKSQLFDPLGMTTTKFFLTDPAERARYAQPLRKDRHIERNSLDVTRWESGGGGLVTTIADFARYGQMLLQRRRARWQDLSQPQDVRGDDDRSCRSGLGRRPQLLLFPRRRFWVRLWLRCPHRSRQCGAAAAGFARRNQMGRRDRRLSGGRPRPGHVLYRAAERAVGPAACASKRQEAGLRCVRKMTPA